MACEPSSTRIPQPRWSATTASSSWSVAAVPSDMPAPHVYSFSTNSEALQKWHSYRMTVYVPELSERPPPLLVDSARVR